MMDLFDSISEKPKEQLAADLFEQISQTAPGADLFDMVPGGPEAEKPTAPIPWEETTPGVVGEIALRSPGVGLFPFAGYAEAAEKPMPTFGKVYEKPFVEGRERPSFAGEVVWPTVKKMGEMTIGGGEATAYAAGGFLEFLNPLPGLKGIFEFLNKHPERLDLSKINPEAGTQAIAKTQEFFKPYLQYQPQTEEGKKAKKG